MTNPAAEPWVLVSLQKQLFGVPGRKVREMVRLPQVTRIPNLPHHVRGLVNLRGQVIPLYDFRLMMGLPSVHEELRGMQEMMAQRRQDHINWISELEATVKEGREFRLATDPRQCKFGKWYYSYQTDDPYFRSFLSQFEAPHNRIHALADRVKTLVASGDKAAPLALIEQSRKGVLGEMMHLFSQFSDEYARLHTEIGVVMQAAGRMAAASVDAVVAMEPLEPCDGGDQNIPEDLRHDPGMSLGRRHRTGDIVVLLDPDLLCP